jgi:hypothetical protein
VLRPIASTRSYAIRAQRRDNNIIDALHLRAGPRTFYLGLLNRKHRLNNFEAAFYLNVDFVRQVALLADGHLGKDDYSNTYRASPYRRYRRRSHGFGIFLTANRSCVL